MITQLKLGNYKCFRSMSMNLGPFNVLIGPNNSGKSSVLDALVQLGHTVEHPLSLVFSGSFIPRTMAWDARQEEPISIEVEVEGKENELIKYTLKFKSLQPSGLAGVVYEEIVSKRPPQRLVRGFGDYTYSDGNKKATVPKEATFIKVMSSHSAIASEMLEMGRGISKYVFEPSAIAGACPLSGSSKKISPSGRGLAEQLDRLKVEELGRFLEIQDSYRAAFPGVEEVVLLRQRQPSKNQVLDPRSAPMDRDMELFIHELGYSKDKNKRFNVWTQIGFRLTNGHVVPAPLASAGMLLYLAYLYLAHSDAPPSVLLVEEPENGNHPRRLKEIIDVLRLLNREDSRHPPVQVIMTTHSPYVLDLMEPEEVFVVTRDSKVGESKVRPFSEVGHIKERLDDLSLGELWYNVGEDLMFGEGEDAAE
jgi:predicted ATPase